jgi:tetratricopeptide (TPR) repeat protein
MALALEDDDVPMLLMKAFSLLKLGKAGGNGPVVEESLLIFEQLEDSGEGQDDFRIYLGLGSAHVARALQYDHEIPLIERRLTSEFLSEDGRQAEQSRLESAQEQRLEHLHTAERHLRRVLAFELQKDNLFATVDLVVVLNSLGEREQEAIEASEQALDLLDESNRFTRNTLDRNTKLSPAARLDLQRQLEANREKERLLRDIVATIAFQLGDTEVFLRQTAIMEAREMLGENQLYNRAALYEESGDFEAAAQDLETLLRMRVRRLDYDEDELAPEMFQRIEALRARHAKQARH